MDSDGEYCGMIETDALEGCVEEAWKRVEHQLLSEEDKRAIGYYKLWDNSYVEWVLGILQYQGYDVNIIKGIEIYS